MPHDVVEASGLNVFKNKLDKHCCKRVFRFHYDSVHLWSYAQTFKDLVFQASIGPFDQYSS